MRIGFLGAGAWGFCLANMLAENGHEVVLWIGRMGLRDLIEKRGGDVLSPKGEEKGSLKLTTELREAVTEVDMVIESVTSKGLRPVLEQVAALQVDPPSLVITSKGIEQGTGLLLCEVAVDVFGQEFKEKVGCLSGPSLADEVGQKIPTSVACAGYSPDLVAEIEHIFTNSYFTVYPCSDMLGTCFGGAMKNIIAIACALSDGLGFGQNTKAALMTHGLHEIQKLSPLKGCNPKTLVGLAGLGDLTATCLSTSSRNYKFGSLIAAGYSADQAEEKIGMVVEGAYTCVSALQLAKTRELDLPITEAVHAVIYENLDPKEAIQTLLKKAVKLQHL